MSRELSIKTWLAIAVPIVAFLVGVYGVGVWKGDISIRLNTVEEIANNNEEVHRDEMWEVRKYFHSLDMNILLIATKMEIDKSELSSLELEMPKRAKLNSN